MKFLAEGIGVLDDVYLRNEELIQLSENINEWQRGDSYDVLQIDPKRSDLEKELFTELLDSFTASIEVYSKKYNHLKISKGEGLRIIRYKEDDSFKEKIDSNANGRVLSGILYLNTDIEGGTITFPNQKVEIQPRAGRLILYPSNYVYPNSTASITKGVKYAVVAYFS